jgi:hypothetical protein
MSDIIGRLLDEAEKAQRKGHLVLAEVCRDASDQLGLVIDERDRLRGALREIARLGSLVTNDLQGRVEGGKVMAVQRMADTARAALKETGHE